ncbi:MBL fold metallo-hydrolase [Cyanobium sp. Morenito 9A2]|uniref:MBL fold metallo-hydrolase n=1 Tax=Cyanobium sp. Morenito 9A2 TaxID=2823718 RepID=UPI0020CFB3CE|nr:MBL fold metallo-hydrolase [Cyanobium sp. Morenito 9A2]MCP9849983.1 MBL fold metallo-hydrolase [Cyanobium sp. Morenito 9A2]
MALPPLSLLRRCAGALGGTSLAATVALGGSPWPAAAQAGGGVNVTSYGHSALLIQGGGATVLINPFKAVACAAGLSEPRVSADVILASSRLLDEGAPVARGKFLVNPGSYKVAGLRIEGVSVPHDRLDGRRFGPSTLWRWKQGGLEIAHVGGTASELRPEDKVLLGRPDLLIIGVGGGAKVYDGAEAAAVVKELQPRRVIPVQYVSGKTPADCDQGSVEPFLQALAGTPVKRVGRSVSLPGKLSDATQVLVLR